MTDPAPLGALVARRYAEALAAAAAADARVNALTEALAEHEWRAAQACAALDAIQFSESFGVVYQQLGDEPPEDVIALLDLTSGEVWTRRRYDDGSTPPGGGWLRARHAHSGWSSYNEWPIADAGPFIAWTDDYGFSSIIREARNGNALADRIRRVLSGLPGYRLDGDSSWAQPDLEVALARVLQHFRDVAANEREARHRAETAAMTERHAREHLELDLVELRELVDNLLGAIANASNDNDLQGSLYADGAVPGTHAQVVRAFVDQHGGWDALATSKLVTGH